MTASAFPARVRLRVLLLVALPALALYLSMLSSTITRGGDCGELTTASYLMGIGHPTGYPVWCQLARLFAFLPLGEVAWRYGVFDALCGALGAGVLAVVAHRLLSPSTEEEDTPSARFNAFWGALGGGWMLAGFILVGGQAILSEVYALAGLQGALILYFLVVWHQTSDWRNAYSLVYLCASVFVLHLSAIFFLPFVFVAAVWKRRFSRARVATCAALCCVALLPWLYLPVRSSLFPAPPLTQLNAYFVWPFDWSHPATLAGFKNHVTAAAYRYLLWNTDPATGHITGLAQPLSELPRRAFELLQTVALQWLWAAPLVLVGALASFRRQRLLAWAMLGSFAFNLAVELNYNVSDQTNFFFPAYLVMALWLALGWAALGSWLKRYPILLPILIGVTVVPQWWLFAATNSFAGTTRVGDLAKEQAQTLQKMSSPARPVQFWASHDDVLWAFWYAQHTLGLAPDVVTPWGRALNLNPQPGASARYVARLKPRFPVVLAQWDDATDARFPLQMLDEAGTMCLASDRALPLPAQPIAAPSQAQARFVRAPLWRGADARTPAILAACLAAFETDFQAPRPVGARDETVAMLEVLMAPLSRFAKAPPLPTQGEEVQGEGDNRVWDVMMQRRRLVAPAGASRGQWLRACVPLWVEPTLAGEGRIGIWTRVVARGGEAKPWRLSDRFDITAR